jgi:hypothetical protein
LKRKLETEGTWKNERKKHRKKDTDGQKKKRKIKKNKLTKIEKKQ